MQSARSWRCAVRQLLHRAPSATGSHTSPASGLPGTGGWLQPLQQLLHLSDGLRQPHAQNQALSSLAAARCAPLSAISMPSQHLSGHKRSAPACHDRRHMQAAPEAAKEAASEDRPVTLTGAAAERVRELASAEPGATACLRLTVEAGGCSGFSYKFALDTGPSEDDCVFETAGVRLLVDAVSLEFVRGAVVDFKEELIRTTFEVVDNPNTAAGCGCGASFAPK